MALISRINYFKHIYSYQTIITINNGHDFSAVTKVFSSIVYIWKGFFANCISNKFNFSFRDGILFNILLNKSTSSIFRAIIYINNMKGLIILYHYRVQIFEVFVSIIKAWYNNTKGYFHIATDIIF